MNYTKTINFQTTSANSDLLQNANIKNAIKEALGLDDVAYTARLTKNPITEEYMGFRMSFDIVGDENNTISINGGIANTFIAGAAYSSDSEIDVHSLILGSVGTGSISMRIVR